MPTFRYRAIAANGHKLDGTLTAASKLEAVGLLRGQGAKPLQVDLDDAVKTSAKTKTAAKRAKKAYASKKK